MSFEWPMPAPAQETRAESQGVPVVPEKEITVTFAHSSGPGGQGVNTSSSKAFGRWFIEQTAAPFTEAQKARIKARIPRRYIDADQTYVYASAQAKRDQDQNEAAVKARIQQLVADALFEPKKRKPTKPTLGSQMRLQKTKTIEREKKQSRREGRQVGKRGQDEY